MVDLEEDTNGFFGLPGQDIARRWRILEVKPRYIVAERYAPGLIPKKTTLYRREGGELKNSRIVPLGAIAREILTELIRREEQRPAPRKRGRR